METNRREFLSLCAGSTLACCAASDALSAAVDKGVFAATRRHGDGHYSAAIFSIDGSDVAEVRLPARGHDIAVRKGPGAVIECVAFARRPGHFAVAFGPDPHLAPVWFRASAGRHFYGHGVFSRDGRLLYTTENDIDSGRGIIGVRDAGAGYSQIGGFSSDGVGPHDIAMLSDGRTLVVANGGMRTHPDSGRRVLNLAAMHPTLSYIDALTGDVLERHTFAPQLHRLSIRHLAVTPANTVFLACQYKGEDGGRPLLIARHRRGEELSMCDIPETVNRGLRNYIASIAVNRAGDVVAATAPRGRRAIFLDAASGVFRAEHAFIDTAGVAAGSSMAGFLFTSGTGAISQCTSSGGCTQSNSPNRGAPVWDNHVVAI